MGLPVWLAIAVGVSSICAAIIATGGTIAAVIFGYGKMAQKFEDHERLDQERFGNIQHTLKDVSGDLKVLLTKPTKR